jgi:hypothetical protein
MIVMTSCRAKKKRTKGDRKSNETIKKKTMKHVALERRATGGAREGDQHRKS